MNTTTTSTTDPVTVTTHSFSCISWTTADEAQALTAKERRTGKVWHAVLTPTDDPATMGYPIFVITPTGRHLDVAFTSGDDDDDVELAARRFYIWINLWSELTARTHEAAAR